MAAQHDLVAADGTIETLGINETTHLLEERGASGAVVSTLSQHQLDHLVGGAQAIPALGLRASQLKMYIVGVSGTGAPQTITHALGVVPVAVFFTARDGGVDHAYWLASPAPTTTEVTVEISTGASCMVIVLG